jgi:hypothetical protein
MKKGIIIIYKIKIKKKIIEIIFYFNFFFNLKNLGLEY